MPLQMLFQAKIQQIFSQISLHLCFHKLLGTNVSIPVGNWPWKTTFSYFFSSFFSSCVFFICVLHFIARSCIWVALKGSSVQTSGQAALSCNEICQRRLPSPCGLQSSSNPYITGPGAPGRWGTERRLSRVKWGRAGFGDQHNLETNGCPCWGGFVLEEQTAAASLLRSNGSEQNTDEHCS